MMPNAPITIQLLSDPVYLSGIREFLQAIADRLGFTDHAGGQIALAVDETICNIIKHGYERRKDRPIWVHVWPSTPDDRPGMTVILEDEAKQVDPQAIKSRDLAEIRPGGLGVHIIREVMDEVIFEKRSTVGMRVRLVRAVDSPKNGAHADCSSDADSSATCTVPGCPPGCQPKMSDRSTR